MLIVLGAIGGSVGTLYFIQNKIKKYVKEFIEKEIYDDNDSIHFESRDEANKVSEELIGLVNNYGYASVADLFDLIGKNTTFEKNKIGWTDLTGMAIS